jgi:hypothetical protein
VPAEAPAVAPADEPAIEIEAAFLKRAQLCASLLNATGAVKFTDMHELTAFSGMSLFTSAHKVARTFVPYRPCAC